MTLTVATYNILHGGAVGGAWSRLAAAIRESRAELVGLQEVDRATRRMGGSDGTAELAALLGWRFADFAPAMPFDGGEYGISLLSRYPAAMPDRVEHLPLPHKAGEEPRVCLQACLSLPEGRILHMLNTHLSVESSASRRRQIALLRERLEAIPSDEPFLLVGDFNTDDPAELAELLGAERVAAVNRLERLETDSLTDAPHFHTFREPPMAIDNIFYDRRNLTLTACGMRFGEESDHNLLWASFAY